MLFFYATLKTYTAMYLWEPKEFAELDVSTVFFFQQGTIIQSLYNFRRRNIGAVKKSFVCTAMVLFIIELLEKIISIKQLCIQAI